MVGPWCIGGNFNIIRFLVDLILLSTTVRRFLEVIEELELRDLPHKGVLSHG